MAFNNVLNSVDTKIWTPCIVMELMRVVVVGYGYAGSTFHVPLLQHVKGMKIVGVVSSDPLKVHRDHPSLRVCATLEQALTLLQPQLVVIASPNLTHYSLAYRALDYGCHVVVDKPFTVTYGEALSLVQKARDKKLLISVFHNRRWDSDFLAVQETLQQELVGDWVCIESRFDRFRPEVRPRWRESSQPGAGLWNDLGPHLLDQALLLAGEPDSMTLDKACQRIGGQSDDWFLAVLKYGHKRIVLHAGMQVAHTSPRWVIYGSKGSWVKQALDQQEFCLKKQQSLDDPEWGADSDSATLTIPTAQHVKTFERATPAGCYTRFYAEIYAYLQGDCVAPPVTAEEALRVMKWLVVCEPRQDVNLVPSRHS